MATGRGRPQGGRSVPAGRPDAHDPHEVARILNDWGWTARRGRQFSGSPDSPDVHAPDFPWFLETKHVERLTLYAAFTQAIADCGERMPAVVHRKNHSESLITLRLEDLLKVLKELE